jgi:hypothetical protein
MTSQNEMDSQFCSTLAEQLPCDDVQGTWMHVCKASVSVSCKLSQDVSQILREKLTAALSGNSIFHAIQLSRHLPQHVVGFLQAVILPFQTNIDFFIAAPWDSST